MDITNTSSTTTTALAPADLIEKAKEYARASKAPATLRTYRSVWMTFTAWCEDRRLVPLPAEVETVVSYVADQAERIRPQTIKKHLAAISQIHKLRGFPTPVQAEPVKLTMQGLRRLKGTASKPKSALRVEHIKKMVDSMPDTLVGTRDKAIILLGYVAGMRRSEVVSLNLNQGDLAFEPEGLVVTIRKSKRDQEGKGRAVAVPRGRHEETCPVRAVRRWMEVSGLQEGPLFIRLDRGAKGQRLSDKSVALVVKKYAAKAGLDPVLFSGHSLRRGFCTETARAGAAERDIARSTGHRSQVLRGYIEAGTLFEGCAAKVLDL